MARVELTIAATTAFLIEAADVDSLPVVFDGVKYVDRKAVDVVDFAVTVAILLTGSAAERTQCVINGLPNQHIVVHFV